jgi:hypothetical protein
MSHRVSAAQRATATIVGRKSPGTEVESTSSKEQDPCVRFPSHGSAIATVMWASGDTTCQLNGAYYCTDVHNFSRKGDSQRSLPSPCRFVSMQNTPRQKYSATGSMSRFPLRTFLLLVRAPSAACFRICVRSEGRVMIDSHRPVQSQSC